MSGNSLSRLPLLTVWVLCGPTRSLRSSESIGFSETSTCRGFDFRLQATNGNRESSEDDTYHSSSYWIVPGVSEKSRVIRISSSLMKGPFRSSLGALTESNARSISGRKSNLTEKASLGFILSNRSPENLSAVPSWRQPLSDSRNRMRFDLPAMFGPTKTKTFSIRPVSIPTRLLKPSICNWVMRIESDNSPRTMLVPLSSMCG